GLEWPVVFCAYLWKAPFPRVQVPHIARFPDGTRRIVFEDVVDGEIPGDTPLSENLRLAYVALTRARSRTYVIWAELLQEGKGAIHHLLSSVGAGDDSPSQVLANKHPDLITRISEDDTRRVQVFPETGDDGSSSNDLQARDVAIAPRQLQTWTVSSYSRFTRGLKNAVDATEVGPVDEAEAVVNDALRADQLPGGAHTGNALHELFERFDFTAIDDQAVIDAAIGDILARYALPRVGADDAQRADAAELVRRMMIGALAVAIPGARKALSAIKPDQTLREWRFHLSMENVSPAQFASVFKKHGEGWLSDKYAPLISGVARAEIDGFLTGIVDLVAQIDGQWWIVDWKSNTLGATAAAYDENACRQVMMHEHYVLQYHIYIVALHRFLRSRLGQTYDYKRDFGGVGYAFLRGLAMGAPSWFVDRPSLELVEALDACIGGYPR
ncbi:MAG: 3'-5' exonuclease, partial [Gemmatimonadales bacterium]